MRAPYVPVLIRFMVVLAVLLLGISSCRFLTRQPQGMRMLFLPTTRACVLVFITDPDSPPAMRATGVLVAALPRPSERAVILTSLDRPTLASSQALDTPGIQVP